MKRIIFILPFILISLFIGILGGFMRLGWSADLPVSFGIYHGLIMTGSFLGGLITLERTMTMKNRYWLIFPFCCVFSVVFFLFGNAQMAILLSSVAAFGLIVCYLIKIQGHEANFLYVMCLGAIFWLIGNLIWLHSQLTPVVVTWWIAFILLTIIGERMELTKFLPIRPLDRTILWILLAGLVGSLLLPFHTFGRPLYSILLISISIWFIKNDMARKLLSKYGYQRYIGVGILTAYSWLILHSMVALFLWERSFDYDLFLHTFFLGFAFSMIWAHAPIILPAVLGIRERPYHPLLWIIWGFFQLSLVGRFYFTIVEETLLRRTLGIANGISILLIFVTMAAVLILRKKSDYASA